MLSTNADIRHDNPTRIEEQTKYNPDIKEKDIKVSPQSTFRALMNYLAIVIPTFFTFLCKRMNNALQNGHFGYL